jgi:hypothetical protein
MLIYVTSECYCILLFCLTVNHNYTKSNLVAYTTICHKIGNGSSIFLLNFDIYLSHCVTTQKTNGDTVTVIWGDATQRQSPEIRRGASNLLSLQLIPPPRLSNQNLPQVKFSVRCKFIARGSQTPRLWKLASKWHNYPIT